MISAGTLQHYDELGKQLRMPGRIVQSHIPSEAVVGFGLLHGEHDQRGWRFDTARAGIRSAVVLCRDFCDT